MNKKGFTLVELLSTLIVLAIVSLIIYTSVKGISQKFRKDAYIESSKGVITAVTNYYTEKEDSYFPESGMEISSGIIKVENYQKYQTGKIYLSAENEFYLENLFDGEFCASGTLKNLVVTKGDCSNLEYNYIKTDLLVDYEYSNLKDTIVENNVSSSYTGTLTNVTPGTNSMLFSSGSKIVTDPIPNDEFTYEISAKLISSNGYNGFIQNFVKTDGLFYGCSLATVATRPTVSCGFKGINNYQTTIQSPTGVFVNTLHTYTFTYDGKTMRLFLNGELKSSKTVDKLVAQSSANLVIGQSSDGGSQLNANVYSVRIYNRKLSETEVKNNCNYNKGTFK